ncbi:phosphate-starvation-inducible PsiE family protein [Staphylococcus equorum]|uniref:phosphate-starvation-inducible PsiE family protein n=1 Tax=Staphylococcus equorum TaxID=246432 RepID=UPI003FD79EF3
MGKRFKKTLLMIALMMTLAIVFPSIAPILQSDNVAHGAPGEGYTNSEEGDGKSSESESKDDKSDDSESSDSESSEDESESGDGEGESKGSKIEGKDSRWTLFSQIIMGQAVDTEKENKEKEADKGVIQKAFDGAVSGIIGDGGVQLNIPYTKFSALNKELTKKPLDEYEGGEEGQALASTFATYSQYGYINSLSGEKLATGATEFVGNIGRFFGGAIAYVSLIFYSIMDFLLDMVLEGLVALNPYSLLGLDDGKSALPGDNSLSKGLRGLFDAMGLNGEFFGTLTELGLIIIVFLFVMKLMINFFQVRFKEAGKNSYKFIVRMFALLAGLPLLFVLSASVAKTAQNYIDATHVTDSPAMSHLIDSRAMSSGLNMSPSALQSPGESPHVSAKENYIDKRYQPAKKESRNRIATINEEAYKNLYDEEDKKRISFDLVGKWLQGEKFDVNTYMADLRSNAELPGVSNFKDEYAKSKNLSDEQKEKLTRRDLESVMWSSTQNTDEALRKPDHKNYDPTMNIGVVDDSSFSTQSVVLMLQSEFDSSSAKFYAYNMAPSGQQANSKNISTIKTEWREISMPGEGMFGVFGSWLSLVSKSLTYVLIATAVIMALISSIFAQAFYKFFKQVWQTLFFGSIHSLLATFLIYLGVIGSVLMAVGLPGTITKFVESIQSIMLEVSQDSIPAGIIEIIGSMVMLIIGYWISWGGRIATTNETPVRLLVTFFVNMALEFESRVAEMNRQGGTSFKATGEGLRQAGRTQTTATSEKIKAGAKESGNSLKGVSKGTMKGAGRGAVKGATIGFATGGVGGAVAMGSKEAVKGAGKGAVAGRKSRDGSKDATEKGLEAKKMGKQSVGDVKSAFSDAKVKKSAMKAEGSQRYASQIGKMNDTGNMSNHKRDQSLSNYQDIRSEEMANSIDEDVKGSAKYSNVVGAPSQPFSKNLTANKDSLDEISGDQHLYENSSKNDLRTMSHRASEEAEKHRLSGDKKPAFTQEEVTSLSEAEGENDFVDKLHNTGNGMEYAMQTENARNVMQGSKFADENGDIQMNKIADYQKQTDRRVGSGEVLSKEELKDKSLIDSAFVMGAKEKYRKPSTKFKDKIGYSQSDKTNGSVESRNKKRDNSNVSNRKNAQNARGSKGRDSVKSNKAKMNNRATQSEKLKTRPSQTRTRPTQTRTRPTQTQTRPTQTRTRPTQTQTRPTQTRTRPTQTRTRPSQTRPSKENVKARPSQTRGSTSSQRKISKPNVKKPNKKI